MWAPEGQAGVEEAGLGGVDARFVRVCRLVWGLVVGLQGIEVHWQLNWGCLSGAVLRLWLVLSFEDEWLRTWWHYKQAFGLIREGMRNQWVLELCFGLVMVTIFALSMNALYEWILLVLYSDLKAFLCNAYQIVYTYRCTNAMLALCFLSLCCFQLML